MSQIDFAAVAVAALVSLVATIVWNAGLFGSALQRLQDPDSAPGEPERPSGWKIAAEYARNLVVAAALAFVLMTRPAAGVTTAVSVSFVVWLGFPAMILLGAVLWQDEPPALVLIHLGDWLIKLLLMGVVLASWG